MFTPNIATPSPIRTPSEGPYSLSERINIATRPVHSTLNRQILARLPLALPPHTTNPSTYVSGLLHVAPIYITFESLWQSLIDAPTLPTNLTQSFPFETSAVADSHLTPKTIPLMTPPDSPLPEASKICPRTKFLLTHLRLPGLLRSQRLRNDIRVLTGIPASEIEQQLAVVALRGRLAEFIAHTKLSVGSKPHVLLAYAWVLYMAMFSGGRHLRRALKDAGGIGTNFWERDPSPVRPYSVTQPEESSPRRASKSETTDAGRGEDEPIRRSARSRISRSENDAAGLIPGMEFFNFSGDEDGEDIKILFKSRIAEAEVLLTAGEKEDIITEAGHIFTFMVALISDLDIVMGTRAPDSSDLQAQPPMVSRDSIDLGLERIEKLKTTGSMNEKLDSSSSSYLSSLVLEKYRSVVSVLNRRLVKDTPRCPSVSFSREDIQIPHDGEVKILQSRLFPLAAWFMTFVMVLVAWKMVS